MGAFFGTPKTLPAQPAINIKISNKNEASNNGGNESRRDGDQCGHGLVLRDTKCVPAEVAPKRRKDGEKLNVGLKGSAEWRGGGDECSHLSFFKRQACRANHSVRLGTGKGLFAA